jgi:hypothetical protein
MDFLDVNNLLEYSNKHLDEVLQRLYLMKAEGLGYFERNFQISQAIKYLTDAEILESHIGILKSVGYFEKCSDVQIPMTGDMTVDVKMKANVYCLLFMGENLGILNDSLNMNRLKKMLGAYPENMPALRIEMNGSIISHNLARLAEFINRKFLVFGKGVAEGKVFVEQKAHLKMMMVALSEHDYFQGTQNHRGDIAFLKNCLDTLTPSPAAVSQKFENIFSNNGFVLFQHIMEKYVRPGQGAKADIAYFYWRLYNHEMKFIHQRPEVFKKWFEKEFPDGFYLGKFRTLDNLKNADRAKKFSAAIEWLYSSL